MIWLPSSGRIAVKVNFRLPSMPHLVRTPGCFEQGSLSPFLIEINSNACTHSTSVSDDSHHRQDFCAFKGKMVLIAYLASLAGMLCSQDSYSYREIFPVFLQIVEQEVLVKEDYFFRTEPFTDFPRPA